MLCLRLRPDAEALLWEAGLSSTSDTNIHVSARLERLGGSAGKRGGQYLTQ